MVAAAFPLSLPPPTHTHVLNGYSAPSMVGAPILLRVQTGAAPVPMERPYQRRTDSNKGINKSISENKSLGRKETGAAMQGTW